MNTKTFGLAVLATTMFAAQALAHHSFSMFDQEKVVKLDGTVKELEWTNPHSWLRIMVEDQATHQPRQWSIELASVGQQSRINPPTSTDVTNSSVTQMMCGLSQRTASGT